MWKFALLALAVLISEFKVEAFCPTGWVLYGAVCIRYLGFGNQFTARQRCEQFGGRLIQPKNQGISNSLALIIPGGVSNNAWLGINNNRYYGGTNDGQPITYSINFYQYIGAYIQQSSANWFNSFQTSNRRYYCELPRTNTECPFVNTIFVENSFPSSSSGDCMLACRATHGCTFWTWVPFPGSCSLKFYEAGDIVAGGGSGARTGFPNFQMPFSGLVLVGKSIKDVENPAECQKLCQKDPKCKSITFNIASSYGNCVFNYGETKRKIVFSGFSNQVVSAPACCKETSECDKPTFSLATELTSGAFSRSSAKEKPLKEISEQELKKYEKELKEAVARVMENAKKPFSTVIKDETEENNDREEQKSKPVKG